MEMKEVARRWPRLTAHLICESLGYFSPQSAANAIDHYKADVPFACEWYDFQATRRFRQPPCREEYLAGIKVVGKDTLERAVANRHHHCGYMADYRHARVLVEAFVQKDYQPNFGLASWF